MEEALAEVSRHKCLIYEGHPSEQLPVVVPFLAAGLAEGRRCLYLGDPEMTRMVEAALQERGVDAAAEKRRGALLLSSDRGHLRDGFDPPGMVKMLEGLIDDALRDGYAGLCATGDMAWELGEERHFDRLQEYEALLERLFEEKPLIGICQYHRDAVPARAVEDAVLTHRSLYLGTELQRDNLFYLPPALLLGGAGPREAHGEWMCRQILRVLRAESKRDHALAALRASEAELRRMAEMLVGANRDLELRVQERTRELEAANRDLESFTSSVSHDLRAPLRAILGFARMLRDERAGLLDEEGRRQLGVIVGGAERMTQMIEDLLRFSQAGRTAMRFRRIDMNALVRGAAQDVAARRPGVELRVGELPPAWGDGALLKHVFVNLLDNAFKYSGRRARPQVEVGGAAMEVETAYWVRDNGAGFDMAQAGKLFKVFQRLHSPKDFEGTGIGLALVQRIVERHGGRVWAEGVVDEGATFHVALPAPNPSM